MNPTISRILALFILIPLVFLSSQMAGAQHKFYRIQIGAYKQLKLTNFDHLEKINGSLLTHNAGNGLTRVLKGDYASKAEAVQALKDIRNIGYKDAFIRTYDQHLSAAPAPKKKSNIDKPVDTPIVNSSSGKYTVQIGAYHPAYKPNIKNVSDIGSIHYSNGHGLKKAMVGRYETLNMAKLALIQLRARGYKTAFIRPVEKKAIIANKTKEVPVAVVKTKPVSPSKKVEDTPTVTTPKKSKNTELALTSSEATNNKQQDQGKKRTLAAKVNNTAKPSSYNVVPNTSASTKNNFTTWARFHNNFTHDYTHQIIQENGIHIHNNMSVCERNYIPHEQFLFMNNGQKKYYGRGRFTIDRDHIGYIVEEEQNNGMKSVRLYVYNKELRVFTNSHYLNSRSDKNANIYQHTQTFITNLNNDNFPDLLQRIIVKRKNQPKSDIIVGKIWKKNGYQNYSISGKEQEYSFQMDFLKNMESDNKNFKPAPATNQYSVIGF